MSATRASQVHWTISAVVIFVFLFVAIFSPVIAPYDPLAVHTSVALKPPSAKFIMGTDELGRDIFSRLIYGARVSLLVGFGSVAIGTVIGVILGLTSAYFGGRYDLSIQRLIDALQAFPPLVLAMVMVTTLGPSVRNVILAIAITGIATRARVVRGTALSLMQNSYVDAARALGCSNMRIMMRYILPNSWAPIIVISTASLGVAIIAESSLSFLGLGPPPPDPNLGCDAQRQCPQLHVDRALARSGARYRDYPDRARLQSPGRHPPRRPRPAPARHTLAPRTHCALRGSNGPPCQEGTVGVRAPTQGRVLTFKLGDRGSTTAK